MSICMTAAAAAVSIAVIGPVPAGVAAPAPTDVAGKLVGRTVFLDPGHQGSGTPEQMARPVDDGRGATKPCQTTGMIALGGMPEHTITWRIASMVKTSLESLGAKVILSRPDDAGWGGCITDRARAANASGADVAVSLHVDGAPTPDHGFHFIIPQLPVPKPTVDVMQSTRGAMATRAMRDAYLHAGFSPADYGSSVNGVQTRNDIAGPALTTVPDVFVEMGNGANPADAARLTSTKGQLDHAMAITTGLVGYLLGAHPDQAPANPGPAADFSTAPQHAAVDPGTASGHHPERNSPGPADVPDPGMGDAGGIGTARVPGLVESVLISAAQWARPLLSVLGVDLPDVSDLVGRVVETLADLLAPSQ